MSNTAKGTVLTAQTPGDCKKAVCDGNGGVSQDDDNGDVADDQNECTTDGCSAGSATHLPKTSGTPCTVGGKVCSSAGKCVECVTSTDCGSMVCQNNVCVGAQCNDTVQNGTESDVDCGGTGTCARCGFNKKCGAGTDCKSQSCISNHCAASCNDTEKDGAETDVDCGGGTCPTCGSNKACSTNTDCTSGNCTGGKCVDVLLISELQTRGSNGGSDEFIEIYNPNAYAVSFDGGWEIWTRSAASNACAALNKRITGAGQAIPAHGHLLFTNGSATGYDGAVAGDGTYTTGFSDSGQIVLLRSGTLVDSLCYYFSTTTQNNLTCPTPPAMWFPCQGTVSNLPHNDTTATASNADVTIERKPGGAAGNGQNTGDNAADWNTMVTPNPQNTMSPATP
ncbi:Hypothetical protein A7982_10161 [Minicystis rosea]|nr:Hypothetical protein A7982_10161 [Minicystis rosea]